MTFCESISMTYWLSMTFLVNFYDFQTALRCICCTWHALEIDRSSVGLTLAQARGGGAMRATRVFLRCTPYYASDRAEILHSLWGILSATFREKNDRIMSGHWAMTSQEVQWRTIFLREIRRRYRSRRAFSRLQVHGKLILMAPASSASCSLAIYKFEYLEVLFRNYISYYSCTRKPAGLLALGKACRLGLRRQLAGRGRLWPRFFFKWGFMNSPFLVYYSRNRK